MERERDVARVATRFATVAGERDEVAKYLPRNYVVLSDHGGFVLIGGVDQAGWTLDGYVIPRLNTDPSLVPEEETPEHAAKLLGADRVRRAKVERLRRMGMQVVCHEGTWYTAPQGAWAGTEANRARELSKQPWAVVQVTDEEVQRELNTYRTETGRVLTDADIQELADEAERGYDVGGGRDG